MPAAQGCDKIVVLMHLARYCEAQYAATMAMGVSSAVFD